ncbi:hypothetical protein FRC08_001567 [Ceratobasidium sp. 394]|nr:hypothetical protein FRC08_001567 [Ceratobasidium sp. 394]KAG9091250.1 hypothetical protein FS749_016678 [Ceratobasidium sp. UAMH 11750]
MPRLATLIRPLRLFGSTPIIHESHTQSGEPIGCPYCSRSFNCDTNLTRHLALRASCRREEERAARAQAASKVDFWSIVEALGQAQIQWEAEARLEKGSEDRLEVQSEAEAEAEVPEMQVRGAEMEVEGSDELTAGEQARAPGESPPVRCVEPHVEPVTPSPSEPVLPATDEAHPPLGTSSSMPDLVFDTKEGDYVERFPDPRAGAPINDNRAEPLDLDAYMAARGNLGNRFHFDTLELLLTTGLTGEGRDRHLKSHIVSYTTAYLS